jgi:hypothetical protein
VSYVPRLIIGGARLALPDIQNVQFAVARPNMPSWLGNQKYCPKTSYLCISVVSLVCVPRKQT